MTRAEVVARWRGIVGPILAEQVADEVERAVAAVQARCEEVAIAAMKAACTTAVEAALKSTEKLG